MSDEIASFERWKDKKKNRPQKGKKENVFAKKRKWVAREKQISDVISKYSEFDAAKVDSFANYPLSENTKKGLEQAGYAKPTAIQQASFAPAVHGRDVLGAAKTGSGKTLAFLIPVLECLYREKWSSISGPGAMIISPTRELAYQTFEVLKKIGQFHDFSAGLVIGGKDVKREAARMARTNILICTPGRLLQHMDRTADFDASTLQMLVLDEADRILDMGFKASLNAILGNLPREKQTLLFSATQTKSVKDLARLSLKDPAYVAVHEKSKSSTPSGLNQNYVICKLGDKLNILYSFIKTHLKTKTLVFLTSCKQVQYVYAAFCKLRPGVPLLMLQGKMNQIRRMAVYDEFCRKKFALMFCTDIAARGLDFPAVDWVVQVDCPEDAETYIHRAGRTARYHGQGHALLFLTESEKEGMLKQMSEKKIPVSKTEINTEKITDISSRLESFCAADYELKQRAQRCFVSYARSVFLMKNKSVFSVQSLPLPEYSASLGLAVTPRIRFLDRHKKSKAKQDDSDVTEAKGDFGSFDANAPADVGDMFSVKSRDVFNVREENSDDQSADQAGEERKDGPVSKVGAIKKLLKKKYVYNQKITFDEEGQLAEAWPPVDPKQYEEGLKEPEDGASGLDIENAKAEMKERDQADRQREQSKIKQRHQESRWREKEARRENQAVKEGRSNREEVVAYLGNDNGSGSDREDDVESRESCNRDADESDCETDAKRMRFSDIEEGAERRETFSDLADDDGATLKDDEKLALYLLRR